MSDTYQFQWAAPDDVDTVRQAVELVNVVSRTDPFIGLPPDADEEEIGTLCDRLSAGVRGGNSHLFTIRTTDELVGCVVLVRPPTPNQRHIGELTTGAVHPKHRGRRLVGRAFTEIVTYCESIGVELLRLDVREGIAAEAVWRAYGFEEYGRLEDYGRVDTTSYTGIYLAQPVHALRARVFAER